MTAADRIRSLGLLSRKWLRRDFRFRSRAESVLVRRSGFTERMAVRMLDALFTELTEARLKALLRAELPRPAALDRFVRESGSRRWVRAKGPGTTLHVFPANVPNAAVTSLILGLVAGGTNVVKVSRRDAGVLPVYLDSLKSHDRSLRDRCRLLCTRKDALTWAGRADLVVAYGEDSSLEKLRSRLKGKARFIGYGSRVSVSLLLKEALSRKESRRLARRTAHDVWMMDQRGCLSPVLIFAQKGGGVSPEDFAAQVAEALERKAGKEDAGPRRGLAERTAFRRLEETVRLCLMRGENAALWKSRKAFWAVAYDERLQARYESGSQIIQVKGFSRLSQIEGALGSMARSLQGAALECASSHRRKLAEWLSVFGVNRVCRSGRLQYPPITWHHDGRLNLADWLTWTDLED